jgi:lysophospholipase L1-like esterase
MSRRPRAAATVTTIALLFMSAMPVAHASSPAPSSPATSPAAGWTYLALGDSNVYAPADVCGSCTGYPHLLADRIAAELGVPVRLIDGSQWNRLTALKLMAEIVRNLWGDSWENPRDASLRPRDAIAAADLITITVAGNDQPWAQDPDPCGGVHDQACIDAVVPLYRKNLDRILDEIAGIRAGRPTAVMVTNLVNDMIAGPGIDPTWFYTPAFLETSAAGAALVIDAINAAIADSAQAHGAILVDLHALGNGPSGTSPLPAGWFTKDFGDLNQAGHDAIAAEMMRLGFAPLVPPAD